MAEDPEFAAVSITTLERWCAEDQWVDQRVRYFESLKKGMESKLGENLVNERVKTLEEINSLMTNALNKLSSNIVEPNSFEGLMSAVVRIAEFREKLLDKIMGSIGPMEVGGEVKNPSRARPKLTVDEIRDMAKVVLQKRRNLQRAGEKVKPKLRLLKDGKSDG